MPTREFHRLITTSRIAHFSGLIWLLLFGAQWAIAINDASAFPEEMVNYRTLEVSARISIWAVGAIAVLNIWALVLRKWWRGDLPPFLNWMITYNVRVAVLWAAMVTVHGFVLRSEALPGHAWAVTHLSLGYAIASSGSVFGVALLLTRRWRTALNRAKRPPQP